MAALHLDNPFKDSNPSSNPFTTAATLPNPFARAEAVEGEATFAMVRSGPPVSSQECEDQSVSALELTVLWGSTVLHVEHLSPPRAYVLGDGGDYVVPAERLGAARLCFISESAGDLRVVVPSGAGLDLDGPQGAAVAGDARPVAELSGARSYPILPGMRYHVRLGDLTVVVGRVAAGKATARRFFGSADRGVFAAFGLSALVAASVVGALAAFVPSLGLLPDEDIEQDRVMAIQQYLNAASERERERDQTKLEQDEMQSGNGEVAEGAKHEAGKMGKVGAPVTHKKVAVQGPEDNPDPHLARDRALTEAKSFGFIGILNTLNGDPNAPTVEWGRETSSGTDPFSAMGEMWGDDLGESGGSGGLALSGIGEGGGMRGESVGLGMIGTCGSAVCSGTEHGFGSSVGRNGPGHNTKGPGMRPGQTEVSNGRLPAEVIQRVVRQNFGRFRMCYEQGLAKNPNLTGRVSVRFAINRDGAVKHASNAGSDLPDSGVVSCVVSAYYGLSFPAPKDGIVTVSYPIMFSPG
jgi:hypothetical protein